MHIRVAKDSDLNTLNNLMHASKQYWGYDRSFMQKFMSKLGLTQSYLNKGMTFIAVEENIPIGFYSFCYHADSQLELDNFFIHPNFIGQGKGRLLWEACVQKAIEYGVKQFIIWSEPHAEQFYLKMGCVKIGERPSPVLPERYPPILEYKIS